MTDKEINDKALDLAQSLLGWCESGSMAHGSCKCAIKSTITKVEAETDKWILENLGLEASKKYRAHLFGE